MLAIFIALGIFSLAMMVRSFFRPLEPTPQKLAATKKSLVLTGWIVFPALGIAINALASKQYYLLGASAILFSFVLPLVVQYSRLKAPMKGSSNPDQTRL